MTLNAWPALFRDSSREAAASFGQSSKGSRRALTRPATTVAEIAESDREVVSVFNGSYTRVLPVVSRHLPRE